MGQLAISFDLALNVMIELPKTTLSVRKNPFRVFSSSKRTSDPISFEYQGATPLTIFGRVTGIRYHFAGPGARTRVDFRDAPILEVMRGFKIVDAATAKSL